MVMLLNRYFLRLYLDNQEVFEEYDEQGNLIGTVSSLVVEDALEAGEGIIITALSQIQGFFSNIDWDGVGTALGKAIAYALTALREASVAILEQTGPIVINTVRTAYNSISEVFLEGGVEIFAAFTTGLLLLMGMIYLLRYVYHAPVAHLGLNAS
jgi:hypothetical protein